MVTDTATIHNSHCYQAGDTIEILDLYFLTNTCQSLITALETIH